MSTLTLHPVRTTLDGMAGIGRTRLDLMGIRFDENDGGNTPPAPAAPATPAVPPAATPPATPAAPERPAGENVADLPAWAQKIITDTRKEAGDHRVALTASETRTAAILAAAGITPDADPVEAARTATAERDTATANALTSARELAIYKAAGTLADPSKLLDSNAFLTSVSGIDPTDGPAILAAITAAVTANPNLKAARAAGASSVDNPGGTGETGQITEAQLAQMTPDQISAAYDKGQLSHLIG
jgi:hypothetical protein